MDAATRETSLIALCRCLELNGWKSRSNRISTIKRYADERTRRAIIIELYT